MISAKRVEEILIDSFFREEEIDQEKMEPKDVTMLVKAHGVMNRIGFHKDRLFSHKEEVVDMLSQLPYTFRKSSGGGWSFLNACKTEDGELWGQHKDMDNLFTLGIGLGLVEILMPREMWDLLPGGMPYLVINL